MYTFNNVLNNLEQKKIISIYDVKEKVMKGQNINGNSGKIIVIENKEELKKIFNENSLTKFLFKSSFEKMLNYSVNSITGNKIFSKNNKETTVNFEQKLNYLGLNEIGLNTNYESTLIANISVQGPTRLDLLLSEVNKLVGKKTEANFNKIDNEIERKFEEISNHNYTEEIENNLKFSDIIFKGREGELINLLKTIKNINKNIKNIESIIKPKDNKLNEENYMLKDDLLYKLLTISCSLKISIQNNSEKVEKILQNFQKNNEAKITELIGSEKEKTNKYSEIFSKNDELLKQKIENKLSTVVATTQTKEEKERETNEILGCFKGEKDITLEKVIKLYTLFKNKRENEEAIEFLNHFQNKELPVTENKNVISDFQELIKPEGPVFVMPKTIEDDEKVKQSMLKGLIRRNASQTLLTKENLNHTR